MGVSSTKHKIIQKLKKQWAVGLILKLAVNIEGHVGLVSNKYLIKLI